MIALLEDFFFNLTAKLELWLSPICVIFNRITLRASFCSHLKYTHLASLVIDKEQWHVCSYVYYMSNFPALGGLGRVVQMEWWEQKLCWWGVAGRGVLGGNSADRRGGGALWDWEGCENLSGGILRWQTSFPGQEWKVQLAGGLYVAVLWEVWEGRSEVYPQAAPSVGVQVCEKHS